MQLMTDELDAHYVNPKLAELYDLDSGWSIEREFYSSLAGKDPKYILDLGCGTGLICNALAKKGHHVTGADPSASMLDVAKRKPHGSKIEWVHSKAQAFRSVKTFDLIIMTGNALQVLLKEQDLIATFQTMGNHLKPGGLIAFETRNPVLDWVAQWNYRIELATPAGVVFESRHFLGWNNTRMTFELHYRFPGTFEELTSKSELRFWSHQEIKRHLVETGLSIERLMGDWNKCDFDEAVSQEMVFFVRFKD